MDTGRILSIDLGGTKLLLGEIDAAGNIYHQVSMPSDVSSQQKALADIIAAIAGYLDARQETKPILAINLAVVGRVNQVAGIWYEIHPGNAQEIQVTQPLAQQFDVPVFLTNDVTSATIAEQQLGIGKQTKDFVYLNVGTGIAARVVADGKIVGGGHFNAGEVGHMVVDMHRQTPCSCGRKGCVESFASGLGMSNEVHRLAESLPTTLAVVPNHRITTERLMTAYETKDPLVQVIIDEAAAGIAQLIMNLVRVADPTAIVVGGGVMSNPHFYQLITEQLVAKTMRFVTDTIHPTRLNPQTIALVGGGINGFMQLHPTQ